MVENRPFNSKILTTAWTIVTLGMALGPSARPALAAQSSPLPRAAGILGNGSIDEYWGDGRPNPKTNLEYAYWGRGPNSWTPGMLATAADRGITPQIALEGRVDLSEDLKARLDSAGLLDLPISAVSDGTPGPNPSPQTHLRNTDYLVLTLKDLRDSLDGSGALPTDAGLPRALQARNTILNANHQGLLSWIALLKDYGDAHPNSPVVIRPLSEINDGTYVWQLGHPGARKLDAPGEFQNRSRLYAQVFRTVRKLFREGGATQVLFAIMPLAQQLNYQDRSIESTRATLSTIKQIGADSIDLIGLTVYTSRLNTAEARKNHQLGSLVQNWLIWIRGIPGFESKPWIVGEMGVKDTTSEARTQWITHAFTDAHKLGARQVTYFNDGACRCAPEDAACNRALADGVRLFQE